MKNTLPVLTLLSLMLAAACKTTQYAPDNLPAKQVVFGEGGGFTGIQTSYILLENGQIFQQIGVNGIKTELESIKAKKAKKLFDKVASLQLSSLNIEKPGNMYQFLRQVNDQLDIKATWGASDYTPPETLVSVYKELKALTMQPKKSDLPAKNS